MTVREIVLKYLKRTGYDGLYNSDCGCELSNLMFCDTEKCLNCKAGYKVMCSAECHPDNNMGWHIQKDTYSLLVKGEQNEQ